MRCPKCRSKVAVVDSVNTPNGETYRKRRCLNSYCGKIFYTMECEIEYEGKFKDEWNKFHRKTLEMKGETNEN